MSDSFVYLLNAVSTNWYKIGYTRGDVKMRVASLQTGCPFKLRLVAVRSGTEITEASLHQAFWKQRGLGEWFEFGPDDLYDALYHFSGKGGSAVILEEDITERSLRLGFELWEQLFKHSQGFGTSNPWRGSAIQRDINAFWVETALNMSIDGALPELTPEQCESLMPDFGRIDY